MSGATVTWLELRPLEPASFGCDLPGCDGEADTAHFLPWVDGKCERVLFACPRHDPGGYHVSLDDLLGDRIDWDRHLLEKLSVEEQRQAVGGWFELARRVDEVTRRVVHVDEPPEPPMQPAQPEQPEQMTPPAEGTTEAPAEPTRRRRQPTPLLRALAAGELTRYGQAALEGLVAEMRAASEGNRNQTLNKVAFRAGQLVGADQIAEDVAVGELEQAALETGLPAREVKTTVRRSIGEGLKQPARIEEPR